MENFCSFHDNSFVKTPCRSYNRREKNDETTSNATLILLPLLSCKNDISSHKSTLAFSGVDNEKDLILLRAGLFSVDVKEQSKLEISPFHRHELGIGWLRQKKNKCSVPRNVARHKKQSVKGDRGVSARTSELVYEMTSTLVPVGSGI